MIAAVSIDDFGALGTWVAVIAILAVAWRVNRGGGAAALDSLDKANHVLERRVRELERQGKEDTSTIAELRGRTDVALAISPLITWSESHEQRAQQRHEATLGVLELIAGRLGPDGN